VVSAIGAMVPGRVADMLSSLRRCCCRIRSMRTVVVRCIGSSAHRLYSRGHVAARMIDVLISGLYECRNNVNAGTAAVLAISGLLVIAPLALHELGAFLRSRQCCCAAIGSWCLACTASSYPPRG
jgi:hypothetical protein